MKKLLKLFVFSAAYFFLHTSNFVARSHSEEAYLYAWGIAAIPKCTQGLGASGKISSITERSEAGRLLRKTEPVCPTWIRASHKKNKKNNKKQGTRLEQAL